MVLSADLLNLLLYCIQQLGITLGVGAMTILLVAYLQAMRDGIVDDKEAQFFRAVRGVLNAGLLFVIVSGAGISVLEFFAGAEATILSPAYLFKWLLIIIVFLLMTVRVTLPQSVLEGLRGGSWYALFVVHILAPVTTWTNLLTLYVVWMAGFALCWATLVYALRGKSVQTPYRAPAVAVKPAGVPQPKPRPFVPSRPAIPIVKAPPPPTKPVPPPIPKPVAPITPTPSIVSASNSNTLPLQKDPLPTISPPQVMTPKTTEQKNRVQDPDQSPGLPALQIMPKTVKDLENQNRATSVVLE